MRRFTGFPRRRRLGAVPDFMPFQVAISAFKLRTLGQDMSYAVTKVTAALLPEGGTGQTKMARLVAKPTMPTRQGMGFGRAVL